MRVTFERLTLNNGEVIAEFDIETLPTEEQSKAIEDEVITAMEEYESENGYIDEFDWWGSCYTALKKHVKIIENPVVKTFYL